MNNDFLMFTCISNKKRDVYIMVHTSLYFYLLILSSLINFSDTMFPPCTSNSSPSQLSLKDLVNVPSSLLRIVDISFITIPVTCVD